LMKMPPKIGEFFGREKFRAEILPMANH
jgi:hypothetical protein